MKASAEKNDAMNHQDDSVLSDQINQLNVGDREDAPPKTEEEYAQSQLTLRAIVSSKEAGVIIGKQGKNVADLREETGVKAGVSKVVQGVHDRSSLWYLQSIFSRRKRAARGCTPNGHGRRRPECWHASYVIPLTK